MRRLIPATSTTEERAQLTVSTLFWLCTFLYAVVFSVISLREYQAYQSHALDLGNMTQAFWNTVHGRPFRFENMRAPINIEAFGTDTRLSFHVEPIIPVLSIVYYFWQHVETLLVLQSVAVASGTIPIRLLVRSRLGRGLPEVVFPLAYLLFPALEASNLYEFHPVTFVAPFLLWAFYFADARRYSLFALTAFLAMGCKEELGMLVAIIGLWIAVRNGDRRFGVIIAVIGAVWSLTALFEIVPHFQAGKPSSYWARYLPPGWPDTRYPVDQAEVRHFWLHNMSLVWTDLTSETKLSYLHRMFMPVGYLSFLSPLTLLIAIPSLALILLSYEPHMYGGLAHYSTELVPIVMVSSILGLSWVANVVAPRLRLRPQWIIMAGTIYVLATSVANQRVNGLSPLAAGFNLPVVTAHDRLINQAIAMIPADASVSAEDLVNAHVSDRANVYLFPDTDHGKSEFILLDATTSQGSTLQPCDVPRLVTGDDRSCEVTNSSGSTVPSKAASFDKYALLSSGKWNIMFAQDGVLLLKRRMSRETLHNVLPASFYTFIRPVSTDVPPHTLVARFGTYLELEGYSVQRKEMTNLRLPDIVLTTWWRSLAPLPPDAQLVAYLTDQTGAIRVFNDDPQTIGWLPLQDWKPGQTYKIESSPLTVTTNSSGMIDVDIGISVSGALRQIIHSNLPVTLVNGPSSSIQPGRDPGPDSLSRLLRVTSIHAQL